MKFFFKLTPCQKEKSSFKPQNILSLMLINQPTCTQRQNHPDFLACVPPKSQAPSSTSFILCRRQSACCSAGHVSQQSSRQARKQPGPFSPEGEAIEKPHRNTTTPNADRYFLLWGSWWISSTATRLRARKAHKTSKEHAPSCYRERTDSSITRMTTTTFEKFPCEYAESFISEETTDW